MNMTETWIHWRMRTCLGLRMAMEVNVVGRLTLLFSQADHMHAQLCVFFSFE